MTQAAITIETDTTLAMLGTNRTGLMTGKGGVVFGGLRIALLQGVVLEWN